MAQLIISSHDHSMWNALVCSRQIILMFHIDNLLLAHEHSHVETSYANKRGGKCGTKDLLTAIMGKLCEFPGIKQEFGAIRNAYAISQHDLIKKLRMNLLDSLNGPCHSIPVPENLFKVDLEA